MSAAIEIIKTCLDCADLQESSTFESLGWDSFDLLTIRAKFDDCGYKVDEHIWGKASNVKDLLRSLSKHNTEKDKLLFEDASLVNLREVKLNMPQMAQGGLSEGWFLKESGDMHWALIARALSSRSDNITDARGERLYATFVRIRWLGDQSLCEYRENDEVRLEAKLSRWGKGFYDGNLSLNSDNKILQVEMLTSFVSREGGNEGLQKGEPVQKPSEDVKNLIEPPLMMSEYRTLRKGLAQKHTTLEFDFEIKSNPIFQWERPLNPFLDLNGVNLLYFAAYPPIIDSGEWLYFQENKTSKLNGDLGLRTSIAGRDIFYFANCSPGDKMIFELMSYEVREGYIYSYSQLIRKSDKVKMCLVFTKRMILSTRKEV